MKGWYGDKEKHSLASRGIRTVENRAYGGVEALIGRKELESMIFNGLDCKNISEEQKNDCDDYYGICSLQVVRVVYFDGSGSGFEAVVDGVIGNGERELYWMESRYHHGSLEEPPDEEFDWMTYEDKMKEIETNMERTEKHPYLNQSYYREYERLGSLRFK